MNNKLAARRAAEIAGEICEKNGLTLWDVEFKKEGADYVLRIMIDKPGGVFVDDCELVSRAMDPILDAEDFIEPSYCLEVSSPGIDRKLTRPEHYRAYIGAEVDVKLFQPVKGTKLLTNCKLCSYQDDRITVEFGGEEIPLPLADCSSVRLSFVL